MLVKIFSNSQQYWLCFFILIIIGCNANNDMLFELDQWQVAIDNQGRLSKIEDKLEGKSRLLDDRNTWIVTLKIDANIVTPVAFVNLESNNYRLHFQDSITIDLQIEVKASYLKMEVMGGEHIEDIDALIWGPYYSNLRESVGETVGIVQDSDFTIGIQGLNVKTLGGYPWSDHDHMPQLDVYFQTDIENLQKDEEGPYVLYSVEAARPLNNGSALQAFTRNRSKDRIIENWDHPYFEVPAFHDGGIIGSKIALFGCKSDHTLATIGKIELEEGLPHPEINGTWIKESPLTNASYLIMDFTESSIETCLDYTAKTGFKYLYHGHPFATWGHFPLIHTQFPGGYEGMKRCVELAEERGISLGTHTLTNFITTDDAYVSPVPDKRLAKVGSSMLETDISSSDHQITISDPAYFIQMKNNTLKSVKVGDEIIRYGSVSEEAPWKLLDCQRGAFGTQATHHTKGTVISKLMDHPYKVFLGNASLNKEIAENIADFMNETGVRMLDFDGLEGTHSTGMGNYAKSLFVKQWYDRLSPKLKEHFVTGASRPSHYFWHIYGRMNWGEPWYAGFRESQTEYRLRNQAYYRRNLMPGMLGWFLMTPETTVEDIQWLMARSAGYDAGFAFVASEETFRKNGRTDEILNLLKVWEEARLNGEFTKEEKVALRDLNQEYRLEKLNNGTHLLIPIQVYKFEHMNKQKQPGEPLYSVFDFENKKEAGNLSFIISCEETELDQIKIELDGYKEVKIPVQMKEGNALVLNSGKLLLYDQYWNVIQEINNPITEWFIENGKHQLSFDGNFKYSNNQGKLNLELRI